MHTLDPTTFLTATEAAACLDRGERLARRSRRAAQNVVIFRLACCGLRVREIALLNLSDLHASSEPPFIRVSKAAAKGHRERKVPLAWLRDHRQALERWKQQRLADGARLSDPVVCTQQRTRLRDGRTVEPGQPLSRMQVWAKFRTLLKALPAERAKQLHPHSARHGFATLAVRQYPLPDVQRALGHANVATTSLYLHADPSIFAQPGNLMSEPPPNRSEPTP